MAVTKIVTFGHHVYPCEGTQHKEHKGVADIHFAKLLLHNIDGQISSIMG